MASRTPTCRFWRLGTCRFGNNCRFAHDPASKSVALLEAEKLNLNILMAGTGNAISIFEPMLLDDSSEAKVRIEKYQFLASYNWSNVARPTIFVPGCPPKWESQILPIQIPKDSGRIFIDQNAYRSPKSPFHPFFKALLTLHPTFDMTPISLITDRNSLRKLFDFVSDYVAESWRIEVEIVCDTMFFTRCEPSNIRTIPATQNRGYGHEFEKAFTTFDEDLATSSGHHRIVQYDLGGVMCLVRYEADAYIDKDNTSGPDRSVDCRGADEPSDDENNISAVLESLVLSPARTVHKSQDRNEVRVIQRGRLVSPSSIVEAKSRAKAIVMRDVIPQLWISQTEHLLIGYHKNGLIDHEIIDVNMAVHFAKWEAENEAELKKLVSLIVGIKEVVKGTKEGKCVLICDKSRPRKLSVYLSEAKGLLISEEVRETCWGQVNKN